MSFLGRGSSVVRSGHGVWVPVAATLLLILPWLLTGATAPAGSESTRARSAVSANTAIDQRFVPRQQALPVRVRIPALELVAPVDPLELTDEGRLAAPDSANRTGWWRAGPEPGEQGPAVIAGHVDSRNGPAVFYELDTLSPGNRVFVDRADGSTAVFRTYRSERHAKSDFPTNRVYAETAAPELRLITCGGVFDDRSGDYLDNVIVFAVRVR
ncbi:Sortase family protein [Actinopolyspora lacussalsi subsp. righensis]|uniref:Sortase family protein n=1 Tax=Actinopolyspora righensis TaxID=995060 RepID=A0A1I6X4Q5_9ACTN|nr:class F sortase [Actinopolyspora righensis]SFT32921.1 Sortase family protein [Actinopolyspora righensis]